MKNLRNVLGAFGDAAILFPILALLNSKAGVPMTPLLVYTGIVYIFSAFYYRLPMPVQPLKSIAIAAVSIGATFSEIRVAGFGVGVVCLAMLLWGPKLEELLKRVPIVLIHQLQVGLGVLLIVQALKAFGFTMVWSVEGILVMGMVLGLLLKPDFFGIPVLGVIATLAFLFGLMKGSGTLVTLNMNEEPGLLRWGLIATLVLPQMALTMGNSVLSTKNICDRLYPEQSHLVTYKRLLSVIGIGNIVVALVGGMPFCHGSGGLTAHHRAGSTCWWSTALLGGILVLLAVFLGSSGGVVIPSTLLTVLLATVGVFHLKLAEVSWQTGWGKMDLIGAALVVALTQNLFLVLPVFGIVEILKKMEARYGFLS